MPKLKSLIRDICTSIFMLPVRISKKMYRNCAILCVGTIAVSVLSFTSSAFSGSGKNGVFAYISSSEGDEENEEGKAEVSKANEEIGVELLSDSLITDGEEETLSDTMSEIMADNSQNEGQLVLAKKLVSDIELEQERIEAEKEETERLKEEIREYKEKKEEERRKAELMEARRAQFNMESFDDADYHNFLRIVEAEAGDNDVQGKMMVANVILNRVVDPKFPNTITGVIFSPGQFSPISNGSFYRVQVRASTVEAVERALNGEDNSQGALFFMDRRIAAKRAASWFDSSLTYLHSYGGHEFFK